DSAELSEAPEASDAPVTSEASETSDAPEPSEAPEVSDAPESSDAAEIEPERAGFDSLGLDPRVLRALKDVGYETPSAIQAATVPVLLEGRDVVGLAQTGTGKTAAFALPILSRIKPGQ